MLTQKTMRCSIDMWSLLNWIDNGQGDHRIGDYGLRNDKDLTDKYAVMLEVYQNIRSNHQFDLNGLEQMVKSRDVPHDLKMC